ncbi:MAG: cobyric acid synthase, partial [Armatimonadetes bacterium]|nr:cobyric acid synthase [Armatimonadota bacterium]
AARLPVVELPLLEVGTSLQPDWAGLPKLLQPGDLLVVGRPHDLSGDLPSAGALRDLAAAHPAVTLVVDEALLDFVAEATSLAGAADNLVVLRSMSQFWAIPGVRLGFAVAAPEVAARLRQQMPEQAVNTLAQAVGLAALADGEYARQTVEAVAAGRAQLAVGLSELGLTVYDGVANLVLGRLPAGWRAEMVAHRLLADCGLAVRTVDGHERAIQMAVRSAGENQRLLDALALVLGRPPRGPEPPRRARSLMFQGTSSHAGKSLLTAALCRILHQDGVRVAPFKAQNMSNNSYIGWDGGELGRAQVLQAQACGLDPDTRMNPVLLKPSSDTASQVILRGRPAGELVAFRDLSYHERAGRVAREAYDELAAEYDVVVLEGAGSPGEVNLKDRDIVNMRMAQHAQSPVLLVGDIDRGGVYASFVGTMEVLAEWERALLRGFVVNKFRGDASLLGPAHDYVLNHTGRPVLGVVPYLKDLGLPEEDGAERPPRGGPVAGDHRLDIAVVEVPHIANLSDFDALRLEPDVRLRVVARPDELGCPDAVLLPGTRNTIDDLAALRARGLAEALVALDGRSELVGICGGYQMLGRQVADPLRLESAT